MGERMGWWQKNKQRKRGKGEEMQENILRTEITKKSLTRRLTEQGNVRNKNSSERKWETHNRHCCRYILEPSQFNHPD